MAYSKAAQEIVTAISGWTERDLQRRVGPSDLGDTCARCLAEKLVGTHSRNEEPQMGSWIGTAGHAYLESLTGGLKETKVVVGEVDGYGTIKGTADHYNPEHQHLIDYKFLGKSRLQQMRSAYHTTSDSVVFKETGAGPTLKKYYVQLSLYAKGLVDAGHPVKKMSLMIAARDEPLAPVAQAFHEIEFAYDPSVAQAALDRAGRIYKWATTEGNDIAEIESDPNCYYCKFKRYTEVW